MAARGHRVEVIAAHPHYPEPRWGSRRRPYRETRDGIRVLRLPLAIGRSTPRQRIFQEVSYLASEMAASPFVSTPDVAVVVTPSFPGLLPAMINARLRRIPWVMWLQDILPQGAVATGQVEGGPLLKAATRFELAAYRSAAHIVVISETFKENLAGKGVPDAKMTVVYNSATRLVEDTPLAVPPAEHPEVLWMGNIGRSQGLVPVVEAFQAETTAQASGARLVLAGAGVELDNVRAVMRDESVEYRGLLFGADLTAAMATASLGAVTQAYAGAEFNVPSKLMNYFAAGLPVVASVSEGSEVARLIERSGGGWVTTNEDPGNFARLAIEALADPAELARRAEAGLHFARRFLTPAQSARQFEPILDTIVRHRGRRS
jgi:colanic acid biosynthesis glycosyl transferase WcaI